MPVTRIAIAGAGIGGLTLALALRARGLAADIYEQADALNEIGAAVALSANGTRELERLGCLPALAACSTEPTELVYRGWRDARRVAAFPVRDGGAYRARFGAPYYGIHRADLQKVLSATHGPDGLHLGHRLASIEERGDEMLPHLHQRHGGRGRPRRGRGRRALGRARLRRRAGIDPVLGHERVPRHRAEPSAALAAGPGSDPVLDGAERARAALRHRPRCRGGQLLRGGGGAARLGQGRAMDGRDPPGEHLEAFVGWAPAIVEMIGALPQTQRWGLFTTKPQCRWWRGRAALIGDAAHAMLPHHGQGANTTIEDAVTLAGLVAERGAGRDLPATLQRFQKLRALRTRTIQRSSAATNTLLHLPDGAGLAARDARLARFPQRFAWIHGFDAGSAVEVAREAAA